MPEIIILADPLSADVFMLTDFEVQTVRDTDAAARCLREALARKYDIVFITETLADPLRQQIQEAQEKTATLLTVIPGVGGSRQVGKEMLLALKQSVVGG